MRLIGSDKPGAFEPFDKPDADPGPDQVAIRVHAAGLNPADLAIRDGGGGAEGPRHPPVMGFDVAGTVLAVGSGASRFAVGDEVYGCAGGMVGHDGAFS